MAPDAERRPIRGIKGTNRRNPDGVLDAKSGVQITLSAREHFVNEGLVYHVNGIYTIATDASAWLELRIPANVEIHIEELSIWTNVPFLNLELLENPTITTPGLNELPIVNRNRSQDMEGVASKASAWDNPIGVSDGTRIFLRRTGSGEKERTQKLIAGSKLILGDKDSPSIYTLEFHNVNLDPGFVSYELVWHEFESEE
jgi:hypothetical protein